MSDLVGNHIVGLAQMISLPEPLHIQVGFEPTPCCGCPSLSHHAPLIHQSFVTTAPHPPTNLQGWVGIMTFQLSVLYCKPHPPGEKLMSIRKTCPCNVYPLEPHFYIVKLGYAGVYLFFLFLLQNIDCVPTNVLSKNKKNIKTFLLKIFNF